MRRSIVVFILLCSYLLLVLFANRALLFSRFDVEYWKDKYEQSQWKLPLSKRTIGDDGLYLYEGYRLIRGEDPSLVNAEVPPLGKYLIGSAIVLFGNGHWYGFLVALGALVATYGVGLILFGAPVPALIITTLLATDPLFTNQYTLTMMDALQAALLTIAILLLLLIRTFPRKVLVLGAVCGGVVGLFSEAKIAILTPILAVIGCVYLWRHAKTLFVPLLFLVCIGFGYILPYVPYFFLDHSLLDWLKLQKWIIAFYQHSQLTPTWGSAIVTLIAGYYQNIFTRSWLPASEWTPVWTVLFLSSIVGVWKLFRTKKSDWGLVLVFAVTFLSLGLLCITPFWTRYLVAILPLLYLSGGIMLMRVTPPLFYVLVVILLFINAASSWHILFPSPAATVKQFAYQLEHSLFSDLYEDLTNDSKSRVTRQDFRKFALTTLYDGEIESLQVRPVSTDPIKNRSPYVLTAEVTYITRQLGSFTRRISIPFVREDNRWRIPWSWEYLIPGLSEQRHLETTVFPARRGSILASDKKPLAEDVPGYLVSVIPERIDRSAEDAMLSTLETVFDGTLPKVAIHQRIVGGTLASRAIAVGVIPHPKDDPNILRLTAFPGIVLTDALTRIIHPNNVVDIGEIKNTMYSECCSRIYSTTAYDGTTGVEFKKNSELKGYAGGSLILRDESGSAVDTFIARPSYDGKNVQP